MINYIDCDSDSEDDPYHDEFIIQDIDSDSDDELKIIVN